MLDQEERLEFEDMQKRLLHLEKLQNVASAPNSAPQKEYIPKHGDYVWVCANVESCRRLVIFNKSSQQMEAIDRAGKRRNHWSPQREQGLYHKIFNVFEERK